MPPSENLTPLLFSNLPPRSPPPSPPDAQPLLPSEIPAEQLVPHFFEQEELLASNNNSGATLWKVVHTPTGIAVAEKRGQVPPEKKKREHLSNEVDILRKSNSPYLTKYFGAYYNECNRDFSLYMEYMDCRSTDWIYNRHGRFPENVLPSVAFSCLRGLKYLEDNRCIHRDIKVVFEN